MALPNYLAYAASKAGVDAVTRGAAVALAPFGDHGEQRRARQMDTAMQRITDRQLAAIEGRNDIDVFLDERTRRIPLGRRTDCETVASTIVWLALDAPPTTSQPNELNGSGGLDKDRACHARATALHQFHHDALRPTDERQPRARIARQWTDCDIRALCAQFLAGGIDVIDRQTDVLQPIIRELRRGTASDRAGASARSAPSARRPSW